MDPLKAVSIGYKGRKTLRKDNLEVDSKYFNRMVSDDNFLNYPDWKIIFKVHTYDSDKN